MNMHKVLSAGLVSASLKSITRAFFPIACLIVCGSLVNAQDAFPRIDSSKLPQDFTPKNQQTEVAGEQESDSIIPEFDKPSFLEDFDFYFYNGWESNYFFEGRDYLDGDGLIIYDADITWKFLEAAAWYVHSPDQSYDEANYTLRANFDIKNFHINLSYTYLDFLSDGGDDEELAAGVVIDQLPADLVFSALAYHSTEQNGFFGLITLQRTFSITDALTFTPIGSFGLNQGYISDGHDGPNNTSIRLQFDYVISKNVTLVARVAQNWAIDRDSDLPGDEALRTFFNGGVGVLFSY